MKHLDGGMSLHDCNNGSDLLSDLQWLRCVRVETSLALTCGVHDVVHQVCEAGRGLVRQQVGEEIPGAKQRQLIQTDRQRDGPPSAYFSQNTTCLTPVLRQIETINLSKKKLKALGVFKIQEREKPHFPTETTNSFITSHLSNDKSPAGCLYYQQHFRRQSALYLNNYACSRRSIYHPSLFHL